MGAAGGKSATKARARKTPKVHTTFKEVFHVFKEYIYNI
jgi:hypothetical protein